MACRIGPEFSSALPVDRAFFGGRWSLKIQRSPDDIGREDGAGAATERPWFHPSFRNVDIHTHLAHHFLTLLHSLALVPSRRSTSAFRPWHHCCLRSPQRRHLLLTYFRRSNSHSQASNIASFDRGASPALPTSNRYRITTDGLMAAVMTFTPRTSLI